MPKVSGGPKELNSLLERVYSSCMSSRNNKSMCSATAWSAAKGAGWSRGKDGKWKRKKKGE